MTVIRTEELAAIEDEIDSVLLRQVISQTNGEFMSADEVLSDRDLQQADLDG